MDSLLLKFGQNDPAAKQDISSIPSSASKPWSDPDDLRYDYIAVPEKNATLEQNYTILDGSFNEFPDDTHGFTWGFWSDEMSDAGGVFDSIPAVAISFNTFHSSIGLTLLFYPHTDDYAKTVRVTWYSDPEGATQIAAGEFELQSNRGEVSNAVQNYRRIKIEFTATNIPHRYVKLYGIDFGLTRLIYDHEIDACRALQEIDPTSESVSVNVLNATIRSRDILYSPTISKNFDSALMVRQMITVLRNGIPEGVYFLDKWQDPSQSGIAIEISGIDAVGILDNNYFNGGIYVDKLVPELLDEIFSICFPTKIIQYVLDPVYRDRRVTGWIPFGTCGFALQHIAFALNATVDTAGGGDVWIYPREEDAKSDGKPTTNDQQPFININDISSFAAPHYFPTMEPNYVLLDGAAEELPDNTSDINLGWCSQSMSNESGYFENPPVLTLTFGTHHNVDRMILDFGPCVNEYMELMLVTFFDEFDNVILSKTYEFAGNPGVIDDEVMAYRKITFEVLKTNNPYRYAKIAFIDWGKSYYIPLSKQYRGGNDRLTEYISGVDVVSHRFVADESAGYANLQSGELQAGVHFVTFSRPMHSLTIAGGTILASNANYAQISVVTPGEVLLQGKEYVDVKGTHSLRSPVMPGQTESIRRYDSFTLVSPDIGPRVAQFLYDFFQSRIVTSNTIVLGNTEVGYVASVQTRGRYINGVIRRLFANLRSNKADIEVIGNVVD